MADAPLAHRPPTHRRRTHPRKRALLVGAALAITVCLGVAATADTRDSDAGATTPAPTAPPTTRPSHDGPVGVDDGLMPDDALLSPFDTELAAIANLDANLRHAVQQAARDAAADDIQFFLTSAWRSRAYQQRLLDKAVAKYGSEEEARRYVDTPDSSHHVTGHAVDVGPTDADDWLRRHGTDYGLCQTYANEMWHFELATSPGGECPQMQRDASEG